MQEDDDEKVSKKKIAFDLEAWIPMSTDFFWTHSNMRKYHMHIDIEGMRGKAPKYIFTGLRLAEIENECIYAGKTEFLDFDAKRSNEIQKNNKSWIVYPFDEEMARRNKLLFIDAAVTRKEGKTWRLTVIGKECANYCDFKSLENARAVYWDIVRGIMTWGTKQRQGELGFFKMINTSGIELKEGDMISWCLPSDICE